MNQKTSADYSTITPKIRELAQISMDNSNIDKELYVKHHVYRGLRDLDGNGVLTGLTEISDIVSSKIQDGQKVSCEGELYYRGISIQDIVKGFIAEKRYGFEEVTYLLLLAIFLRATSCRNSASCSHITAPCRQALSVIL